MSIFYFKYFSVNQKNASMKVGTDAMILGALIKTAHHKNALDIGAGTGVLSLMCAQKNKDLFITAIDIDKVNTSLAKENFNRSEWTDNLEAIEADIADYNSSNLFDLIFSNPPFYLNGIKSQFKRTNNAKHISSINLFTFFQSSYDLLSKDGSFWIIIPFVEHREWTFVGEKVGFQVFSICYVYGKDSSCKRLVIEFKKNIGGKIALYKTSLIIRNHDGTYTKEYKKLTEDFHSVKI